MQPSERRSQGPTHIGLKPFSIDCVPCRWKIAFSLREAAFWNVQKRTPPTARSLSRGPWALIALPFSVWAGACCYWNGVGGSMFLFTIIIHSWLTNTKSRSFLVAGRTKGERRQETINTSKGLVLFLLKTKQTGRGDLPRRRRRRRRALCGGGGGGSSRLGLGILGPSFPAFSVMILEARPFRPRAGPVAGSEQCAWRASRPSQSRARRARASARNTSGSPRARSR